jgi:enoyl-CoA hydratase
MSTDNSAVLRETHGRVAVLRINRPEAMNALNDDVMNGLTDALNAIEADEDIGCVIITGSDKVFAAGADIAAMRDYNFVDVYKSDFITRNWERLKTFRKPTIAAVAGFALGGGCEVAMMCDMLYAAESAKFGLPEIKLGTLPGGGGTQRLPRAIGKAKAMDMCFTARMMDAQEAERSGLVSRVVPDAELMTTALQSATQIASYSLPTLMLMKEAINRAYQSGLDDGLMFERRLLHASFALEDFKEGRHAFLDKRKPQFSHK